ncbi:MAG: PepSY domain-containing protein [Nocardioidaceae bacterium]
MSSIAAAIAGVACLATLGIGGTALAHGSGDDGGRVSSRQAELATTAALHLTDGGTANSVERDGENGATWEVEVTRPDGVTVDVRLDESYRLVVIESDSDRSG